MKLAEESIPGNPGQTCSMPQKSPRLTIGDSPSATILPVAYANQCIKDHRDEYAKIVHNNNHILPDPGEIS